MSELPGGCLIGCLSAQNVACFPCAKWHREIRQHSMEIRFSIVVPGLPALATCRPPGNLVLPRGCLEGCL